MSISPDAASALLSPSLQQSLPSEVVHCRKYSEAQQRCYKVLSNDVISSGDICYVLDCLPQPRNSRRVSVIPAGQTYVFSQAMGLTTQHNSRPTISSLCSKCPLLASVLSRFVLQYDPSFEYTTITINYNYASAAHRDVNHEGGKARIIAVGDFIGGKLPNHAPVKLSFISSISIGELHVDTIGTVDIKDKWFDFDGTLLHSTEAFIGERYSLVYFTHTAYRDPAISQMKGKLLSLGIPFPDELLLPSSCPALPPDVLQPDLLSVCSSGFSDYLLQPSMNHQKYQNALFLEYSSLASLHGYSVVQPLLLAAIEEAPLIYRNVLGQDAYSIGNRAVTFSLWKILTICNTENQLQKIKFTLSMLVQRDFCTKLKSIQGVVPTQSVISVDAVVLGGPKLTTSQKRKLLSYLNIRAKVEECMSVDPSASSTSQLHRVFNIVIVHDKPNGECAYYLCERVGDNSVQSKKVKVKKNDVALTAANISSTVPEGTNGGLVQESSGLMAATPLKECLCQLVCNVAQLRTHDLCYDPFCGSGSLIKFAEDALHCVCIGSDVQPAAFSATPRGNDSEGAGCRSADLFVGNIYHMPSHAPRVLSGAGGSMRFDAIICDPPYGRRERHVDSRGCDKATHSTNEERAWAQFKILTPLLAVSAELLRPGGRLVFLFMNFPSSERACWDAAKDLDLPVGMRIIGVCREQWNYSSGHTIARDIVIVEKAGV